MARETDAEAICAIWNPVIRDTTVTFNSIEKTPQEVADNITQRLAKGYGFFVCDYAGGITGFAAYSQFRGGVGYAKTMEHTIIIDPAAHGRGVGRLLMTSLCDFARDQGVMSLFAGVSATNHAGLAFHRALGFAEVAVLQKVGFKFDRYLDLVLLQKFL